MTEGSQSSPSRRADAVRNRERIIEAAERVFAAGGDFGPEAIAREAGVGVGTVYRHFPDRNDLAAAVYDEELHAVAGSVKSLLDETTPLIALRRWMDRFALRLEKKRAMAPALRSLIESRAEGPALAREKLVNAAQEIIDAGAKSGEIRRDVQGEDIVTALIGVCVATADNDDNEQLGRLLDMLGNAVGAYGSRRFGPLNR